VYNLIASLLGYGYYTHMTSKTKHLWGKSIVALLLCLPGLSYASGESYNSSSNPFEYTCGTSDSIEVYDLTADNYLPGYSDSDYDNCGASIPLTPGNEYEGAIRSFNTVTLSIDPFTAVSLSSSNDLAALAINAGNDSIQDVVSYGIIVVILQMFAGLVVVALAHKFLTRFVGRKP